MLWHRTASRVMLKHVHAHEGHPLNEIAVRTAKEALHHPLSHYFVRTLDYSKAYRAELPCERLFSSRSSFHCRFGEDLEQVLSQRPESVCEVFAVVC